MPIYRFYLVCIFGLSLPFEFACFLVLFGSISVLLWPCDPVGSAWRARIFVVCLLSLESIAIGFIGNTSNKLCFQFGFFLAFIFCCTEVQCSFSIFHSSCLVRACETPFCLMSLLSLFLQICPFVEPYLAMS